MDGSAANQNGAGEVENGRAFESGNVNCLAKKKVVMNKFEVTATPFSYPSEFFGEHPAKPIVSLAFKSQTLVELENAVFGGLQKNLLSVELVNAYLYKSLKGLVAHNKDKWTSYGVKIADANSDVDPFIVLDVKESDGGVLGEVAQCPEDVKEILPFLLCTLYRLMRATNEQYRNALITKMKNQPEGIKAAKKFQIEVLVNDFFSQGWLVDKNYKSLLAGLDMFYYRFPRAEKSNIRFGTKASRYRDCAALLALQHAMDYFGIYDPLELLQWIYTESVALDVYRLFVIDEEIDIQDSYFPYQIDLGLVSQSAYSASLNQNLYYWASAVCAIHGDKTGCNARFFLDKDVISTRKHTLFAGYILSIFPKEMPYTNAGKRGEPPLNNPVAWYDYFVRIQYNWTEPIRAFFRSRRKLLSKSREGTIGHHLYAELDMASINLED